MSRKDGRPRSLPAQGEELRSSTGALRVPASQRAKGLPSDHHAPAKLPAYNPEGDEIADRARAREARNAGVRLKMAADAAAASITALGVALDQSLTHAQALALATDAAARALETYRGKR